jgi:hypothetical protein
VDCSTFRHPQYLKDMAKGIRQLLLCSGDNGMRGHEGKIAGATVAPSSHIAQTENEESRYQRGNRT